MTDKKTEGRRKLRIWLSTVYNRATKKRVGVMHRVNEYYCTACTWTGYVTGIRYLPAKERFCPKCSGEVRRLDRRKKPVLRKKETTCSTS